MKYYLILAIWFICFCTILSIPVYAHDRNPPPTPVIPAGGNDNHNNNSDNLKHLLGAAALGGLIGLAISYHPKGTNDVKENRDEIRFKLKANESR